MQGSRRDKRQLWQVAGLAAELADRLAAELDMRLAAERQLRHYGHCAELFELAGAQLAELDLV